MTFGSWFSKPLATAVYVVVPSVSIFKQNTPPNKAYFENLNIEVLTNANVSGEKPRAFFKKEDAEKYLAEAGGYDGNVLATVAIPYEEFKDFKVGKTSGQVTSVSIKNFKPSWVANVSYSEEDTKNIKTMYNPLHDKNPGSRVKMTSNPG